MSANSPSDSDSNLYSRTRNVRARYGGVSDMWITRRMRDDGFPKPVQFGTSERFWKTAELDGWDRVMIARGLKENKSRPPSRTVQS
jgi:predicted DNA-binding transcriptional regulator AlpA